MNSGALVEIIQKWKQAGKILEATADNAVRWLQTAQLPEWALASMQELLQTEQFEELNNRFFKTLAFGTSGLRGRMIGDVATGAEKQGDAYVHAAIGTACMNDFNVILATLGVFKYCKQYLEVQCEFAECPKLVIAYDSRYFSEHFCHLTASVWRQCGGDVYLFEGPRSTPQLSFTVRYIKATVGIVITASHNPFYDNGYKVYFRDGAQIDETHANGILKAIQSFSYAETIPFLTINLQGAFYLSPIIEQAYMECCTSVVLDPSLLRRMSTTRIVYTPLHGTGSVCILPLLITFSWKAWPVDAQLEMDGAFPTVQSPNPDNLQTLRLAIEQADAVDADAILATDPDADRLSMLLRDSRGQWQHLSGNVIAILLAEYRYKTLSRLKLLPVPRQRLVVMKSFVTTPLLRAFAKYHGLKCIETHTGFKWMGAKLNRYEAQLERDLFKSKGVKLDYAHCSLQARREYLYRYSNALFLAAEESSGFLADDAVRDKDGNAAALMACELVAYLKSKNLYFTDYLNAIYDKYGYFKEDSLHVAFKGANGVQQIQALMHSFRQNPPKRMADLRVLRIKDFLNLQDAVDGDNDPIPAADFMVIYLLGGCQVAIRPSGTEAKLRMYLFGEGKAGKEDDLETVKAMVDARVQTLKAWLQDEIAVRMPKDSTNNG